MLKSINSNIYYTLFFVFLMFSCTENKKESNRKTVEKRETRTVTPTKKEPSIKVVNKADFGGFRVVPTKKSNLKFANRLTETKSFNYFNYEYIYNGGGVAVGDINNDGYEDIYLTGNQVPDKLFLNKGNLEFEDISKSAGIAKYNKGDWHTGVTMVDLNADGFLDIYVCRSGPSGNAEVRRNLFFENNKDGTFTEKAKELGIADETTSVMAVFFDMDNDGDLDLFVGNHPVGFSKMNNIIFDKMLREKTSPSDRLYENVKGKFKDITISANVYNFSYSLGLAVNDFNDDGFQDIFISNDYEQPDMLYINLGNNTFKDVALTAFNHIANFGMGCDAADLNNDGLTDIINLDMAYQDPARSKTNMPSMNPTKFYNRVKLNFHYQYMHNCLQLNMGNLKFSDVAYLSGVAKTDWSWSVLAADYNNDAFKDLYITNGYRRDMMNNDYNEKLKSLPKSASFSQVFNAAPSTKMENFIYENNKDLTFTDKTKDWNLNQTFHSNGAAYSDLDNDGDLDLILNNVDDYSMIYENIGGNANNYLKIKLEGNASNTLAIGSKVVVKTKSCTQTYTQQIVRGYQSSVSPIINIGLGDDDQIENLKVYWWDNSYYELHNFTANQTLAINKGKVTSKRVKEEPKKRYVFNKIDKLTKTKYNHKEKIYDDFAKEILLPQKYSQLGPCIKKCDFNGDKLDDFFIGGAAGFESEIYLQQIGKPFKKATLPALIKDKKHEDVGALFFDADGDGDEDLYIASGSNEFNKNSDNYNDRLYINNNGKLNKSNKIPKIKTSTKVVLNLDFDKDGDEDLFVGGRIIPGEYPFAAKSYFLKNNNGKFVDATKNICPSCADLGMVTDAVFTDFDKDGDKDLIVTAEWQPIIVLINNKGKFEKANLPSLKNSNGWWYSITANDLNNDGFTDYIIGNLGTNSKFKATKDKPFLCYANDFDDNGKIDIVLSFYDKKGKCRPVRGRQCSSEQMPFIADKFSTFAEFSEAGIFDIHTEEKLNKALKCEVKTFKSAILWNNNGKLELENLPIEAQFGPTLKTIVDDFNNDGKKDILTLGNIFQTEVETSRYDANQGCLLLGLGNKKFKHVSNNDSGIYANQNVKDATYIKLNDGANALIIANNNAALETYVVLK